jgi:hypothetical protein
VIPTALTLWNIIIAPDLCFWSCAFHRGSETGSKQLGFFTAQNASAFAIESLVRLPRLPRGLDSEKSCR